MDFLQVALVLLIVLLGVLLSILGLQVFLILKDLRGSLERLDKFIQSVSQVTSDLEKPLAAVADVTEAVTNTAKIVKSLGIRGAKSAKRSFKRK